MPACEWFLVVDLEVFILILSGFLSGIFGSLGVGGGGVLIVFLTLFLDFSRQTAAFINLLFFIPIALFSTIIYAKQKQIDFKKVLFLVPTGLVGSAFGVYLSNAIQTDVLSKIFGLILIFISLKTIFAKEKSQSWWLAF